MAHAKTMFQKLTAFGVALLIVVMPFAASAKSTTAGDSTMPSCPVSDPVVWVNTNSKIYHAQGDRFFGKTKSGVYACTSKAIAMGARAVESQKSPHVTNTYLPHAHATPTASPIAETKHRHVRTTPSASPTIEATPTPSATPSSGKKRHHRHAASPQASATP